MKKIILLFFVAYLCHNLKGQGVISGVVLDEGSSETLIGANVVIEGTTIGTSTDFDGKYQFGVEPGIHQIVVSYIGYNDKIVEDVEVKDGEITYLDITLGSGAVALELNVVVQAETIERSENAVLMLQRKSDKIVDGLSAQEMSKYALSDAASALTKISGATVSEGKYIYIRGLGDRYSSAQLDGLPLPSTNPYRNTPQLDLIPTNLLDNIITSKSFSPDLPGNFTGGNVNLKTKTLPEQFFISLRAGVSYNRQNNLQDLFLTYQGGAKDYWGYDDGGRDLPGVLTTPNFAEALNMDAAFKSRRDHDLANKLDDAINMMNLDFSPEKKRTPLDHSFGISTGNQLRLGNMPLGYIFAASFKKSFTHLEKYLVQNWDLFDINSGNLRNKGDYEETKSGERGTVNSMLGLNLRINKLNSLRGNLLYNHSGEKTSRFLVGERPEQIVDEERLQGRGLTFEERELVSGQFGGDHAFSGLNNAKLEWKLGYTRSNMNEPSTRYFSNVFNTDTDHYYIPLAAVQLPAYYYRKLDDEQLDAKIDFELPLNEDNRLKIGGLYTGKDRSFDEKLYQIFTTSFAEQYSGSPRTFLSEENIGIIELDEARDQYRIGNHLVDFTAPNNSYIGHNRVTAGYAMWKGTILPKFRIVAGARYEKTDMEVVSGDENKPLDERTGKIDQGDILPVANFIYTTSENANLRAAYSRTLARPNMREMAPFVSYDPLTASFIIGNTAIQRTTIDNYDLRWEWFVNPGEILAVSAYYKDFSDPISSRYLPSSNTEIKFINVDRAKVYGVEFEFRKSLGFLSPSLSPFKFSSNFSLIHSEVDVHKTSPYEPETRPFEGQAPYVLNAALLYDDDAANLDVTLALNWVGDRLRFLGQDGAPDIYDQARQQLDLNVQKKFGNLGVSLNATNLLNSEFVLSSEYRGNDYLYSRYKTGVSMSLGFSYDIR